MGISQGAQWMEAMADWCRLGSEAMVVLPLRIAVLAGGGEAARDEAQRMIDEKIAAHGALLAHFAQGGLSGNLAELSGGIARHYLPWVRANRQRLTGDGTS